MQYQTQTLPNGLRIIHLPSQSSVSYCGVAVGVGTRDEQSEEWGMAHFVEHMLFKGTKKRKAWHILNRLDSVGGELNAYTTKEETFYYAIFGGDYMERSIELIADIVLNSSFPAHELKKEVEVILDEINSYKDNPSELIIDEFENMLFTNHSLGHNTLGDEDTLLRFTPQMGIDFVRRYYTAPNMVFFSVGNTPFSKLVRWVSRYFEPLNAVMPQLNRMAPTSYIPITKREKMDTFQSHVMIGNRACDMRDKQKPAMALLNNILGGSATTSRLNVSLRERGGYVYSVESNLTTYGDTGYWNVYFGSDPKNSERCINMVLKELFLLRQKELSPAQLAAAKRQLLGQIVVGSDNFENSFLSMGKSYLHFNRYDSLEELQAKIIAIDSHTLWQLANTVFDEKSLSQLVFF